MEDLIAKLEAAKEGSRELDAVIAYTIDFRDENATEKTVRDLVNAHGFDWFHKQVNSHSSIWQTILPHYTTSLDAALTLVPEYLNMVGTKMLPMQWGVGTLSNDNKPEHHYCANVRRAGITGNEPPYDASSQTPALALCIAALKVRT